MTDSLAQPDYPAHLNVWSAASNIPIIDLFLVTGFGEKPGPITILFSCAKVLMETEIGIFIGQVCYLMYSVDCH